MGGKGKWQISYSADNKMVTADSALCEAVRGTAAMHFTSIACF